MHLFLESNIVMTTLSDCTTIGRQITRHALTPVALNASVWLVGALEPFSLVVRCHISVVDSSLSLAHS